MRVLWVECFASDSGLNIEQSSVLIYVVIVSYLRGYFSGVTT